MKLTVDGLTEAIFSLQGDRSSVEKLQAEVRDAMIADLMNRPTPETPENSEVAPLQRVG